MHTFTINKKFLRMRVLDNPYSLISTFLHTIQSQSQHLLHTLFTTIQTMLATQPMPSQQQQPPILAAAIATAMAAPQPSPTLQQELTQRIRINQLPAHLSIHSKPYGEQQRILKAIQSVHKYARVNVRLPINWTKMRFHTLINTNGTCTTIEQFLNHAQNFGRHAARRWRQHNQEVLRFATTTRRQAGTAKPPKPNTNKLRLLAKKLRLLLTYLNPPQQQPANVPPPPPLPTDKPLTPTELEQHECPITLDAAKVIPASDLVVYEANGAKFVFDVKALWCNLFRQPATQCDRTHLAIRDRRNPNTREPFAQAFIDCVIARMRLLKRHGKSLVCDDDAIVAPVAGSAATTSPTPDSIQAMYTDVFHQLSQAGFDGVSIEMMRNFCAPDAPSTNPPLKRWYEEAARFYHHPAQFSAYTSQPRGRDLLNKYDPRYNRWEQQFEAAHLQYEVLHTMQQLLQLFGENGNVYGGAHLVIGCMTVCSDEFKQVFPDVHGCYGN